MASEINTSFGQSVHRYSRLGVLRLSVCAYVYSTCEYVYVCVCVCVCCSIPEGLYSTVALGQFSRRGVWYRDARSHTSSTLPPPVFTACPHPGCVSPPSSSPGYQGRPGGLLQAVEPPRPRDHPTSTEGARASTASTRASHSSMQAATTEVGQPNDPRRAFSQAN